MQILIGHLSDADWRTRARAVQVLARVASENQAIAMVSPLAESLRDKDPLVRYYATEALTAIGARAVPALINLLWSKKENERARAALQLHKMGRQYF